MSEFPDAGIALYQCVAEADMPPVIVVIRTQVYTVHVPQSMGFVDKPPLPQNC